LFALELVPPHTALPPPASGLALGVLVLLQLGRGLLVGRPEVGQPFVVLRHNVVHPDNQVVKGVIVECVHVKFGSNWHLHKSGKAAKGHSSQEKFSPHPLCIVHEEDLTLDWCKLSDVGLPKPDLVCFMDDTEGIVKNRENFGEGRFELEHFQRKVKENYMKLSDSSWVTVSTDGTLVEVEEELYNIVEKEVNKIEKGELGKLWVGSAEGFK